jgi:hypothetical protein
MGTIGFLSLRALARGTEPTNADFPDFPVLGISCDPGFAMKILLSILAVVLVAASFFADYKWRKWMADRRRNRS